ncbi:MULTISPECIES: OmpA/MotB family protein [unclassified Shewanella]|uniref:OmpA/MotB family protein n=1 Tax=Shewanella TaxID=22 RepID=UPI000DE89962|nr:MULTISPECIES: OmpA family protein [unclassified Shewanella]MCU8020062.1 OmpA family protein [Shewanella sp. SM78]MCU8041572.1 OmpA family protein [Shewanella sp. SM68]MCU8046436.1 OmpA family protein [Shewanella sp. SM65]MCU8077390.1 OmpA family protein [Shewanella sp. SM103]MCU8084302.1 OmpA family protein [Shewanella sp. SM23]
MDRLSSRRNSNVDEENPYWMSFSDLMSALLVIFILATVALIIELTQKSEKIDASIQELQRAEEARRNILVDIKEDLAKQNIIVEIVENDTVLRIPESTLSFKSAKDTLPEDEKTQTEVAAIGDALHKAITKEERWKYLDTVFVEGHTDSVNIWYRGKGNWGLSTDRAVSIWKLWQEKNSLLPKLNELKNFNGQLLFSVSGYADTRRVDLVEKSEDQRARNRRIDIRFTVKKPKIEDYKKAKDV